MPAIKKKWIKASQDGGATTQDDDNGDVLGDDDKDHGTVSESVSLATSKPKKRPSQSSPQHNLLRGLDAEVLLEKRKRFTPPSELKLSEWLDNNLEKRTEETLYLPHLYKYYTELCQADGSDILDVPEFNRMVKEKFGKSFGVKETSVYKALIKERKINQEKKPGSGIKLKEIVHEAINHFGNPWGGVRFFALKQYIGTKYPALQIDLRPKLLKRTLEMGVQYGQIDLVKGIGMAGFYRLPGGEPPPKPKPKSKKEEGDEKSADDSDVKAPESADEDKPEDSTENGEKKESSEETKKKKKHKHKKAEKISLSKVHHGNPEKMEDIFPLAITYQSAPKAASVPKIRKYILEKYGETVPDTRWRKAIESGAERGYWEHVSGSGITGSVHLLMDDFNPASEQIEDRICAALIACHEPKSASASLIKKYISQYHPDFKVDERPDKFKKALLRAVSKNMIVQLSGLGANGSFQLTSIFTPSPTILAGEDDSSEEEGYNSEEETAYVPRGTKSRGVPKPKTVAAVPQKSAKGKVQKKPAAIGKGRARQAVSSYAESSDEELERPAKKQKKKPSKGKKKKEVKAPLKKQVGSELSSDEEVEPEYTPRKSQSRGNATPAKASKKAATPSRVNTPRSARKAESADEEEASSDLDKASKSSYSSDEEKPPPSKATPNKSSRKAPSAAKEEPSPAANKNKRQTPSANKKPTGKSPAPTPKGQKSPKTPKEAAPSKRSPSVDSDEEGADSELEQEYTPRKSKSRGGEMGAKADDTRKPANKAKGKKSRSRK